MDARVSDDDDRSSDAPSAPRGGPPIPLRSILEAEIEAGVRELDRPSRGLLLSGLSAGLEVGFGPLWMAVVATLATEEIHPLWRAVGAARETQTPEFRLHRVALLRPHDWSLPTGHDNRDTGAIGA